MRPFTLRLAVAGWLVLASMSPAMAEDIDLYTGIQPDAGKPNVLIVLDNAGHFVMEDAPARVGAEMRNFLEALTGRGSGPPHE